MTEYTVTDLTPGGIYNITVHRVRGNVEGSGTFISIVAGIQILFGIFKVHIYIAYYIVQDKISMYFFKIWKLRVHKIFKRVKILILLEYPEDFWDNKCKM